MDQYGLPWEASDFLLQILYEYTKRAFDPTLRNEPLAQGLPSLNSIEGYRLLEVDGRRNLKGLPARTAIWCWRIHQAAAGLDEVWAIVMMAEDFAMAERVLEVFGSGDLMDFQQENALFTYKPWLNAERRDLYERHVSEGLIQKHPIGNLFAYK